MKKYKVVDIYASLGLFLDEEVYAESESDAWEQIIDEIDENIGNYIDIEFEEIYDEESEGEENERY